MKIYSKDPDKKPEFEKIATTEKEKQEQKVLQLFAMQLTDEQAVTVPLVYPVYIHPSHYIIGDKFRYNDVLYKVLQEHDTQDTWKPDITPSLYVKVIAQEPGGDIPEWEQPSSGNAYMKGDKVIFACEIYESLIDNNVWSPSAYPAGWKKL